MTIFYLQIAVLAICARLAGEVASRVGLPMVVGEILVGVGLGPTLFRHFFPQLQESLFPPHGNNHIALATVATFGITLFLLVAGMEVDLKLIAQQRKVSTLVSLGGIALPFVLGFVPAYLWPDLLGAHSANHPVIFALFVGAALSITSLPIMAKTLIDLGLYRTPFGMLITSAAVIDDVVGWTIAGIVFSLDNLKDKGTFTFDPIITMIAVILLFVVAMMTVGRRICDTLLSFVNANFRNPSSIIGLIIGVAALGASFTQWIGIHGLFGAFMVGVVVGSSPHLSKPMRESIDNVVSNFLAPLYFAAVGLHVNFIANFSWPVVAIVILAACTGKVVGCFVTARITGLSKLQSIAVGTAMNSRGSIEIVFGMMALQEQIINEKMFVALAIMSLFTCSTTGFFLKRIGPSLQKEQTATK